MDFSLDTKAAASFGKGSQFISESGKYVGKFYRAAHRVSQQGTLGVDLLFRTDTGETADYITLWHTKANGERLSGFGAIQALQTCLRIRGAKKGPHNAEEWDKNSKTYIKKTVEGYPDFCGKNIGVVIQETLEDDGKGGERKGKHIVGFFEASTELTAAEILGKATKPGALEKQLAWLATHPVKDNRKNKSSSSSVPSSSNTSYPIQTGPEDWSDDIPF